MNTLNALTSFTAPTANNTVSGTQNTAASAQSFGSLLGGGTNSNMLTAELTKLGYGTSPAVATSSVSLSADLSENALVYSGAYDANNPSENMASGAVTPEFSRMVTVYDSKGQPQNLNIAFLKTSDDTWSVEIAPSSAGETKTNANEPLASGTIAFNSDGSVKNVSPSLTKPLNIKWADGAQPSDIAFNWGKPGTSNVLSQNSPFPIVNYVQQNGAPKGALDGVQLGKNDQATLSYSNGTTKTITLPRWLARK